MGSMVGNQAVFGRFKSAIQIFEQSSSWLPRPYSVSPITSLGSWLTATWWHSRLLKWTKSLPCWKAQRIQQRGTIYFRGIESFDDRLTCLVRFSSTRQLNGQPIQRSKKRPAVILEETQDRMRKLTGSVHPPGYALLKARIVVCLTSTSRKFRENKHPWWDHLSRPPSWSWLSFYQNLTCWMNPHIKMVSQSC